MPSPSSLRSLSTLTIGLIILAACGQPAIAVKDPYARPSPTEGGTGGAFMTIVNHTKEPDRLVSAQCPVAQVVELHETINDNGVMRMRPQPDGFEVPSGGTVELKPGGKHVMLIGLTVPLKVGESVEITLNFEKAGAIKVQAPVRAP